MSSSNVIVKGALAPNGVVEVSVDTDGKFVTTPDLNSPDVVPAPAPTPVANIAPKTIVFQPAQVLEDVRLLADTSLPARGYSGGPGPGFTMTASGNGALNIDTVDAEVGDRVLALIATGNGSHPSRKAVGIYVVVDKGSVSTPWIMTRATDFDTTAAAIYNSSVNVTEGDSYAQSSWIFSRAGTQGVDIDVDLKMNWVTTPVVTLDILAFVIKDLHALGGVVVDGNVQSRSASVTEDVGVGGQVQAALFYAASGGFITDGGNVIPNDPLTNVPDATGGAVIDAEARAAINGLLALLRGVLLASE